MILIVQEWVYPEGADLDLIKKLGTEMGPHLQFLNSSWLPVGKIYVSVHTYHTDLDEAHAVYALHQARNVQAKLVYDQHDQLKRVGGNTMSIWAFPDDWDGFRSGELPCAELRIVDAGE